MLLKTQVALHERTDILRQLQGMQFTMREMTARKLRFLLAIWLLISLACGLTGPFGTYDALGLWARLPYWGLITAVSIAVSERV